MASNVVDRWRRIETWLAAYVPEMTNLLAPPATDADIATTEHALGYKLPAEY